MAKAKAKTKTKKKLGSGDLFIKEQYKNHTPQKLKAKVGAKCKYRPHHCEEMISFMSLGYSFEAFAGKIGVTRDTLYQWEKKFPEFKEAKKIAFEQCRIKWESMAIDNMINESNGSNSTSLNSSVWIFNMKNRFKWRDKQPDEEQNINITIDMADRLLEARKRLSGNSDEE